MENETKKEYKNYKNGVFYFTNSSKEEFIAVWNNISYNFKPKTTSPILIEEESSFGIQEIRKIWALQYAEREYLKSEEFKKYLKYIKDNKIEHATPYTDSKLKSYIESCLEELDIVTAEVKQLPKNPVKAKSTVGVKAEDELDKQYKSQIPEEEE